MSISRRDLLKRGTLLSAAAAITAIVPSKLRAVTTNSALYLEETFQRLKGSNFRLTGESLEMPVYLTLVGIEAISSGPHSARDCSGFILRFLGGPAEELKQEVYTFSSLADPGLGSFQMLTVPATNRVYEVVVFRLAENNMPPIYLNNGIRSIRQ